MALSGPVNVLARRMRRGFAITLVYLGLLAIPLLLIALIVPPLITEANDFADNVPRYAEDVTDFVQRNDQLRELNRDYDIPRSSRRKQPSCRTPSVERPGRCATWASASSTRSSP